MRPWQGWAVPTGTTSVNRSGRPVREGRKGEKEEVPWAGVAVLVAAPPVPKVAKLSLSLGSRTQSLSLGA